MRDLSRILAAYEQIDQALELEREAALATGDQKAAERIVDRQLVNDNAYFVLCWGQLEAAINDACRALIRRRRASARWDERRGFDIYEPDDRRLSGLSFDRRVALVLDRSLGTGSPFARVMVWYEIRNRIAHGRIESKRYDVSEIVEDFYLIQGALDQ